MLIAISILPFYAISVYASPTAQIIGCWGVLLICNIFALVSFGIPSYLAVKNLIESARESTSMDSSTATTATVSKENLLTEMDIYRVPFKGYSKVNFQENFENDKKGT